MEVRELRDEDVPAVVRLLSKTYLYDLTSEVGFRHAVATTPARGRQRLWVAVDEGAVVAFAGARLHLLDAGGDNGLCGLTVAGGYRGRGLGSDLFATALEHLREAGARRVMTGTLRAFRGRGLARLIKLRQLEWAAASGITSVVTDNDATNAPMLAVNERLGYRPFHEVGSYVLELD